MRNIFSYANVALCFFNIVLAILYLAKDWEAHKKSWRRLTVLFLIILSGLGAAFSTIYNERKAEGQQQAYREQIAALEQSVLTANKNQQDNTKTFLAAFDKMSLELANLKTKVDKAGLQKEAAQLKEELVATKKALTPSKASLTFSLVKPLDIDAQPVQTVTLPVKNNVVHVELYVMNQTYITALNGEIIVQVCDVCKFASEPPGFTKLSEDLEIQRNYKFDRIFARGVVKTLTVDIQIPPNAGSMEFVMYYRCTNCVMQEERFKAIIICSR